MFGGPSSLSVSIYKFGNVSIASSLFKCLENLKTSGKKSLDIKCVCLHYNVTLKHFSLR
jgi:hypothetical protein